MWVEYRDECFSHLAIVVTAGIGTQVSARSWPFAHNRLTDDEVAALRGIPVTCARDMGFLFGPDSRPSAGRKSTCWIADTAACRLRSGHALLVMGVSGSSGPGENDVVGGTWVINVVSSPDANKEYWGGAGGAREGRKRRDVWP